MAPRARAVRGGAGRPGLRPMTCDLNPVTGARTPCSNPVRTVLGACQISSPTKAAAAPGICRIRAPHALGMACTRLACTRACPECPECPERRRRLEGLSTGRARQSNCGPGSCAGLRLQDAALPISGVSAGKHALRRRSCIVRLHHEAQKLIPAAKTRAPRTQPFSQSPAYPRCLEPR